MVSLVLNESGWAQAEQDLAGLRDYWAPLAFPYFHLSLTGLRDKRALFCMEATVGSPGQDTPGVWSQFGSDSSPLLLTDQATLDFFRPYDGFLKLYAHEGQYGLIIDYKLYTGKGLKPAANLEVLGLTELKQALSAE